MYNKNGSLVMQVCTCTCKMYRLHWHVKKYQVVSFIQNIGLKYVNIYVCKCTLIYDYLIKCIWTLKLQYQYLVVLTGKASPSIYSMVMATSRSQTLTVSHWGRVWVTRVWMVTTISSVSCQNHTDLQNSMSEFKLHWWFLVKHQYQIWISKHGLYSR